MNLHRIEGEPEWSGVKPKDRNSWQKLAAATKGFVTPGNFFSVLGLLSVPIGLWLIIDGKHYLAGAIVLAAGRLCDLLDGWAADKTGTKSPLGEKIDASFDKISTGLVLLGLWLGTDFPLLFVVLLLVPHLLITPLALAAYRHGKSFHPSLPGKLSMALIWLSIIVSLVAAELAERSESMSTDTRYIIVPAVIVVASFILSTIALAGYVRQYWQTSYGR